MRRQKKFTSFIRRFMEIRETFLRLRDFVIVQWEIVDVTLNLGRVLQDYEAIREFLVPLGGEMERLDGYMQELRERIVAFEREIGAGKNRRLTSEEANSLEYSLGRVISSLDIVKDELDTILDRVGRKWARMEIGDQVVELPLYSMIGRHGGRLVLQEPLTVPASGEGYTPSQLKLLWEMARRGKAHKRVIRDLGLEADLSVSVNHALIYGANSYWYLWDLSVNGTRVNGKWIGQYGEMDRIVLEDSNVIELHGLREPITIILE